MRKVERKKKDNIIRKKEKNKSHFDEQIIHLRIVAPDQFQYFFDRKQRDKKLPSLSKSMPMSGDKNNNSNNNNNEYASETTVFNRLPVRLM